MEGNSEFLQPPPTETTISKEFLTATFRDPTFVSHIKTLADHAKKHTSEGGFIVVSNNGQPDISNVIKSRKFNTLEDQEEAFSTDLMALSHTDNPQYNKLLDTWSSNHQDKSFLDTIKRTPPLILRQNLILAIHSHPLDRHSRETAESILVPSTTDLETWETHYKGKTASIFGILVNDGKRGRLLLFQANPHEQQNTYYQQWDDWDPPQQLYRYMRESGIRNTIINLPLNEATYTEAELTKLEQFAT
jgi:hypothetical protein